MEIIEKIKTNKLIDNPTEIQKRQIPRGAREARPPWGAAEGAPLLCLYFL